MNQRPYVKEDHNTVEYNGGDTDDCVEDGYHGYHQERGLVEPSPGARHNLQTDAVILCSVIQSQYSLFCHSKGISQKILIWGLIQFDDIIINNKRRTLIFY